MWQMLAAQLAKSAMEAQDRRKAQNEARTRQRASIGAQRAREMGYPVYGIGAASLNRDIANQNEAENPLAMMIAQQAIGSGAERDPISVSQSEAMDEDGARRYRGYYGR